MAEINKIRADPTSVIANLTAIKDNFNRTGLDEKFYKEIGIVGELTIDGVAAVDEAIDYLTNTATTAPALYTVNLMNTACQDHVSDMASTDNTGNIGEDTSSPLDRLNRYGTSTAAVTQNDGYKRINGADFVLWMLIADGDASRAARLNILDPNFTVVGIYSGAKQTDGH